MVKMRVIGQAGGLAALVVAAARGQVTAPPAFEEAPAFRTGTAAPVEGTSHVSARREEIAASLVRQLDNLSRLEMTGHERSGFTKAHGLVKQRFLAAAVESFTEAQRRSPSSRPLSAGLAVTQFLAGRYDESAALLLRIASEAPGEAFLVELLGETAGISESHKRDTEAALRRLVKLRPDDGAARFYLGQFLATGQDTSAEAEALFRESASLGKTDSRPCRELARLAEQRGAAQEAVTWFEEALRRDPGQHTLHYRLGRLYLKLGRPEVADEHLRKFRASQSPAKN